MGHLPVLCAEVVSAAHIVQGGCAVDATFGRGGHSRALLQTMDETATLWVVDRDPEAILVAEDMAAEDNRVKVCPVHFAQASSYVSADLDFVLMDLGVSSPQLDQAGRGFSFQQTGPLDMRMDSSAGQTASEWLQQASESDIAWVLSTYGEEPHAALYAKAIVQQRQEKPLLTTQDLVDVVMRHLPQYQRKHHPATLVFQAIRIYINDEQHQLMEGVRQFANKLKPGGRMAVISYHSLEHLWVVKAMKSMVGEGVGMKKVGGAVKASKQECAKNSRARSALLRVWEKK